MCPDAASYSHGRSVASDLSAPGVLVAFANKHRSAGEIAGTIAAGLAEANLEVDVLPVEQVERMTATKPWSWAAVCT